MIPLATKQQVQQLRARYSHEEFIRYTWQKSTEPFIVGMHTKEICRLIDEAIEDYRHGKSTFLVIKVPFRHGKSDMISRYLPPHFLGEFPDSEVMLVTYASSLAEGFSRFGRTLMRSDEYKSLYPNAEVSKTNGGVQQWGIEGHTGILTASGLSSGITGKGYHLGLCDDYCASRAEAESETIRNSTWEHFTNDFLTRRAPVSITIVLATQWHEDDVIGRIEKKINPDCEEYDEDFPKFKIVSFPAHNGEADIGVKDREKYGDNKTHIEHVKYEWLFPERFSASWYKGQFASLGDYASSGLLQCNPVKRGGNQLRIDKIQWHDSLDVFPKTKYYRVWDLAHTAKQTQKQDPDYTAGTLLTYTKKVDENGETVWVLWIKNVTRFRLNAPERDGLIRQTTEADGASVGVAVESSLDSKDTVSSLQNALAGRRVVTPIRIKHGDKVARMSYVEPIFDAGNVHVYRGDFSMDWLQEAQSFPSGKHDDMMDNITAGYELICEGNGQMVVAGVRGF